jgi:hypothetical protein
MERDFILVAKAAENEQRWMPIVIRYSKIAWLAYITENTVVYRLRIDAMEMGKLKRAIDELVICESLELFEYVDW